MKNAVAEKRSLETKIPLLMLHETTGYNGSVREGECVCGNGILKVFSFYLDAVLFMRKEFLLIFPGTKV